MPRATPLVDEIANELATWPGIHVERESEDVAIIRYERFQLGMLDRAQATAQLHFSEPEYDQIIEEGDASPSDPAPGADVVSHPVDGPSDVTAVLALFDRRYRDLRGGDDPYTSEE